MKDFDKLIRRDTLTLADFFAVWCGPCRAVRPVLERLQREMDGRMDLCEINIDAAGSAELAARYGIRAVPTLLLFRRGEVLWRHSGTIGYETLKETVEKIGQDGQVTG